MIKKLLLISALSMICASSYAQFINLQIRVEPELSASVEQDLDFGQLIINSGVKEIELEKKETKKEMKYKKHKKKSRRHKS